VSDTVGYLVTVREAIGRAVTAAGFRFAALDLAGVQSGEFTLPLIGDHDVRPR